MKYALFWPVVIVLSMLALAIMVVGDFQTPIRTALTLWFLLFCSGMAYARLLSFPSRIAQIVLAVALGITINVAISEILVVGKVWSSDVALGLVMGTTTIGVVLQLLDARRQHARAQIPLESEAQPEQ
ncbi:MAG: hypothetical protein GXY36_05930 [Chloroflexi bacterium]|nr:hypothetical protein [Chloroflexota bacterium]